MEIKRVLISQPEPSGASPYTDMISKWGLTIDFHPFFRVEGVSVRDFVAQRVTILDYTAIVFTSRLAIDSFFHICEQTRVNVPETMKYFCQSEAIAVYLQKYIVYRKRKIFFGTGSPESIVGLIGPKHKGEKFLITMSDSTSAEALTSLFDAHKLSYATGIFVKSESMDLKDLDIHSYDMVVFYNPADIKSLEENFPDFKQGNLKMVSYGRSIVKAMEDAGLRIDVKAPSPEAPSVASAIELYLKSLA